MSEIKINTTNLDNRIKELETLKSTVEGIVVSAATKQGGGQSIDMINKVDRQYADIRCYMLQMINNSISFFKKVSADEKAADQEAAAVISE